MSTNHDNKVIRRFRSLGKLNQFIDSPESYEYIRLGQDMLSALTMKELAGLALGLRSSVDRGIYTKNTFKDEGNPNAKMTAMQFWTVMSENGWSDRAINFDLWERPHGSPFIHDFNYLRHYRRGKNNLEDIDNYELYSNLISPFFYEIEKLMYTQFPNGSSLKRLGVKNLHEAMAGIADMSYYGHFIEPYMSFFMSDMDVDAGIAVIDKPWREGSRYKYFSGPKADVKHVNVWAQAKRWFREGKSLAYIGRGSCCALEQGNTSKLYRTLHDMFTYIDATHDFLVVETLGYDTRALGDPSRYEYEASIAALSKYDIEIVFDSTKFTCYSDLLMNTFDTISLKRKNKKVLTNMQYNSWKLLQATEFINLGAMAGFPVEHMYYYSATKDRWWPVTEAKNYPVQDDFNDYTYLLMTSKP